MDQMDVRVSKSLFSFPPTKMFWKQKGHENLWMHFD